MSKKRTFTITNDFDGNDQFEVKGTSLQDALLAALEALGWHISENE